MAKKRFLLRIDQRVYDAMEKWAADDLRSVNAQMEYVLSEALKGAGRYPKPAAPQDHQQVDSPAEPSREPPDNSDEN